MKKKMKQENKIEVVCWRFVEKQGEGEADSVKPILPIVKCVAGFVTKENKKVLRFLPPKVLADLLTRLKFRNYQSFRETKYFLTERYQKNYKN